MLSGVLLANLSGCVEWYLVTWVQVIVSCHPCAVCLCLRISVSPSGVRYFARRARECLCVAACSDAAWDLRFAQRTDVQVQLEVRQFLFSNGFLNIQSSRWSKDSNIFFFFFFFFSSCSNYIFFCFQLPLFSHFAFPSSCLEGNCANDTGS